MTARRQVPLLRFLGVALSVFLPLVADANPDPLTNRKRPTLDGPSAPPPAPRPAGGKSDARDKATEPTEDGPEAKTAVVSASRSTEAPERADAAPEAKKPGSSGRSGEGGKGGSMGVGDGSYLLGPKDLLRIEIWNRQEAEYEWRPVMVADDGTINVPLLDNVKVKGLTVTEAITKLTGLYNEFIIQPQVFLQVEEYNSRQVNVNGEVKNPGRYAMRGDMTVGEVISMAGDVTKYASRMVHVVRESNVEGEESQVFEVDLAAVNAGDQSKNIHVQPDDTVLVLTNKAIIYVSGMVKSEGYVDWEEGMTALQAVILAGGWADGASPGRTKVIRFEAGKAREFKINLKDAKKPFVVLPGDIIKVPKSIF